MRLAALSEGGAAVTTKQMRSEVVMDGASLASVSVLAIESAAVHASAYHSPLLAYRLCGQAALRL